MWRKIADWYYWRRYGICPVHLTLARSGGCYMPKWICDSCDNENTVKHENRIQHIAETRQRMCLLRAEKDRKHGRSWSMRGEKVSRG